MRAEIISVQSESYENIYNTNSSIANSLALIGITIAYDSILPCNKEAVLEASKTAVRRSDIIIFTNACGRDNMVKNIVVSSLGLSCETNFLCCDRLDSFPELKLSEESYNDATLMPKDAHILVDSNNPFCAFSVNNSGKIFIFLPDTQTDHRLLLKDSLVPYLSEVTGRYVSSALIKSFDITEEQADLIFSYCDKKNIVFEHRYTNGISEFLLTAVCDCLTEADELCEDAIVYTRNILKEKFFEIGDYSLPFITVESLRKNGLTVATAESCTGGMLSQTITEISGASSVIELGVCSYSNRIKHEILEVPSDILDNYGAVSKETASYLAKGIKELSKSDLGISITGVAGPSTSEGKPVGTVYIALYDGENYWIEELSANEGLSRKDIRQLSANTALNMLRLYCMNRTDNFTEEEPAKTTSKTVNTKKLLSLIFTFIFTFITVSTTAITGYFVSAQAKQNKIARLEEIFATNNSLEALVSKNSDLKAWLRSKNGEISLPVCQTNDNSYYLSHDFYKKSNSYGCLFFDKSCVTDSTSVSDNLVIYGKNLDNHAMFGSLYKYKDINYLRGNATFTLTFDETEKKYQIIAFLITNGNKEDDNGYVFPATKTEFLSDAQFYTWFDELKERSLYKTDVDLSRNDKLLTLVTDYDMFNSAKIVVVAKEITNTQPVSYTVNTTPRYPQAWYDKFNAVNPFYI